jgi:GAF domain-containing protein
VDSLGDDPRWSEAFPWLARTGQDRKLRRLLEETEAVHRSSAFRLRGLGRDDLARQAEQFAAWARLDLDEPLLARRLYAVTRDLREISQLGLLLAKALEGALDLAGADRGNVQVFDAGTGTLRIAVQHGFGAEFLDHFAVVDDDGSACGRAARQRAQTVIADVRTDASFAPHRHIAASSAFCAVQSTPLTDRTGRLVGVVSTHYPRPHSPPARDLEVLKRYGYLVGQIMTQHSGLQRLTGRWAAEGSRSAEIRARRSVRLSARPGR